MFRKEEYSSTNPEIMLVRLHPFSHYIEIELSLVWVSVWCLIMSEKPRCVLVTTIHQCCMPWLSMLYCFLGGTNSLKFKFSKKGNKIWLNLPLRFDVYLSSTVQLFSKANSKLSFEPKSQRNYFCISALASKGDWIKKK